MDDVTSDSRISVVVYSTNCKWIAAGRTPQVLVCVDGHRQYMGDVVS